MEFQKWRRVTSWWTVIQGLINLPCKDLWQSLSFLSWRCSLIGLSQEQLWMSFNGSSSQPPMLSSSSRDVFRDAIKENLLEDKSHGLKKWDLEVLGNYSLSFWLRDLFSYSVISTQSQHQTQLPIHWLNSISLWSQKTVLPKTQLICSRIIMWHNFHQLLLISLIRWNLVMMQRLRVMTSTLSNI